MSKNSVLRPIAADKCCYLNPWRISNSVKRSESAIPLLASVVVWSVCAAVLWERHSAYLEAVDRDMLAYAAQCRFLLAIYDSDEDINILAAIRIIRSQIDQLRLARHKGVRSEWRLV